LPKKSSFALLVAVIIAIGVNLFYFISGTELTTVVSRTIFGNLLIVLSMVPIYETARLQSVTIAQNLPQRIRSGMAPVAVFTLVIAFATFVLFKIFGAELVAQRMAESQRMAELQAVLDSATEMSDAEKQKRLDGAAQIYSPAAHVLVVLLSTLFVGFISSITAALVIRK